MSTSITEPMIVGYTRDKKGKVMERHLNATANTLTAMGGGTTAQYVFLPQVLRMERTEEERRRRHDEGDQGARFSKAKQLTPRTDSITNTLTSAEKDNLLIMAENVQQLEKPLKFRIRKLTPRECYRLQGVSDSDIDKIQNYEINGKKAISKTQQYKQAGNSITVDVMFYMFKNLFIGTDEKAEPKELSLFGW